MWYLPLVVLLLLKVKNIKMSTNTQEQNNLKNFKETHSRSSANITNTFWLWYKLYWKLFFSLSWSYGSQCLFFLWWILSMSYLLWDVSLLCFKWKVLVPMYFFHTFISISEIKWPLLVGALPVPIGSCLIVHFKISVVPIPHLPLTENCIYPI